MLALLVGPESVTIASAVAAAGVESVPLANDAAATPAGDYVKRVNSRRRRDVAIPVGNPNALSDLIRHALAR